MVTIDIDDSTSEGRNLFKYAKTLDCTKVRRKTKWEKALEEGAVSSIEFVNELRERIEKWPTHNA